MVMERKVEFIRGFPVDGALDNYETMKSGETHNNGDVVIPTATGVSRLSTAALGGAAGAGCNGGVVFAGSGDSAAASISGKSVVVWGNAIINADETMFQTIAGLAEGDIVTYIASTPAAGEALKLKKVNSTDKTVGVVLKVGAAGTGLTATTKAITVRLF